MNIFILVSLFILSIGLIVISCFFFKNAMEWLGKRFELSEEIIGNTISIIGTSIPQMIIPLVAFIFLRDQESIEIGVGAVIGAPFILSTLGFFTIGLTIISLAKKNKREIEIEADNFIISRDMKFFLTAYSMAIFAGTLADKFPKVFIGFILLIIYGYYIYRTVVYEESVSEEFHTPLYFSARGSTITLESTVFQLVFSLIGLIGGAYLFIHTMKEMAILAGSQSQKISLILSIIFVPIVIELPSKFNSITWLRESKDTLTLNNIISSMIFQACILVILGILFSPWKLQGITILVGCIPIVVTAIIYTIMTMQEKINSYVLLGSGGFYLVFIVSLFFL